MKVIAAKGEMAKHPQLEGLPDLGSDPTMGQFPDLSITDLRQLQLAVHAPQPRNSVLVGTARPLLPSPLLLPFLSSPLSVRRNSGCVQYSSLYYARWRRTVAALGRAV